MRFRRLALIAGGVLALALAVGAWAPFDGGEAIFETLLSLAQSPYVDSAATSFMAATCPFGVSVTIPAGVGNTLTGISATTVPIAVGDQINDIDQGHILYGTTVTGVSGTSPNITVTLSSDLYDASFTGAVSNGAGSAGNTLNVTNIPIGSLAVGDIIQGAGIASGTTITALGTGSGGDGTYTISGSAILVGQETMTSPPTAQLNENVEVSPAYPTQWTWDPAHTTTAPQEATTAMGLSPEIDQYHATGATAAVIQGSIAGATLTVASVTSGALATGDLITGAGISLGTTITGGSGSSWTLSSSVLSQSVATEAVNAYAQANTFTGAAAFPSAFPRYDTSNVIPTWNNGDVFVVKTAVYGVGTLIQPQSTLYCNPAVLTTGSQYIDCPSGTYMSSVGVGDYVYTPNDAYYNGSNGATITAVNPAGCTNPCIEVSVASGETSTTEYIVARRPTTSLTIVGQLTSVSGTPTRPAIIPNAPTAATSNIAPNASVLYIGNFDGPATTAGVTMDNIDIDESGSNGTFTGSISGTALTVTGSVTGTPIEIGDFVTGPGIPTDTTITGGSGTSWTISGSSIYIPSTTMTTGYFMGGQLGMLWLTSGLMGTNTFENMEIQSNLPFGGGDGVISSNDGIPYTSDNFISQGVLAFDNVIVHQTGLTTTADDHGFYIGDSASLDFELTNSWVYGEAWGHLVKSRAGTTTLSGDYLDGSIEPITNSGPSSDLDVPCGGAVTVENTILAHSGAGPNGNGRMISYGEGAAGHTNSFTTNASSAAGTTTLYFAAGTIPSTLANPAYAWDITNPTALPYHSEVAYDGASSGDTIVMSGALPGTVNSGDQIGVSGNCPSPVTTNSLDVHNNSFVTFAATYDGNDPIYPMSIYQLTPGAGAAGPILPTNASWPFASGQWDIKNNEFAGFCPWTGTGNAAELQLPWYGTQYSGAGIAVTQAISELSQIFSPSPKYAPSGDTSNVGAVDYQHQAVSGGARALATIGAVD